MSQRIKEYHCSLLHHQLSLLANEISVLEPFLPLNIITEERKKEKEREKRERKKSIFKGKINKIFFTIFNY